MVQKGNSDNKVNPIGTRRVPLHLNVKAAQVEELYHAHADSSRRLERIKHCHSVESPTAIFVWALSKKHCLLLAANLMLPVRHQVAPY